MKKYLLPLIGLLCSHATAQDTAKLTAIGKDNYMTCLACHGADGQGAPAGGQKMAPPLAGSKIVNGDPALFALVVMKGIQKENPTYLGVMSPLGLAFDDEKLAGILTYVRSSFGNKAAAVTPDDMKKYRAQWQSITTPVTRAKLEELGHK